MNEKYKEECYKDMWSLISPRKVLEEPKVWVFLTQTNIILKSKSVKNINTN
jgi:hypothetical protein